MGCFLTWIGEFADAAEALKFVAKRRQVSMDRVAIPSQRRYVEYFKNVMDGTKPRPDPVVLRRVIVNSIPRFFSPDDAKRKATMVKNTAGVDDDAARAAALARSRGGGRGSGGGRRRHPFAFGRGRQQNTSGSSALILYAVWSQSLRSEVSALTEESTGEFLLYALTA